MLTVKNQPTSVLLTLKRESDFYSPYLYTDHINNRKDFVKKCIEMSEKLSNDDDLNDDGMDDLTKLMPYLQEEPLFLFPECFSEFCGLTRNPNHDPRYLFERKFKWHTRNTTTGVFNWAIFGSITTQEFFLFQDFLASNPKCNTLNLHILAETMDEYIDAIKDQIFFDVDDNGELTFNSLSWEERIDKHNWLRLITLKFQIVMEWFFANYPTLNVTITVYKTVNSFIDTGNLVDLFTATDYYDDCWWNLNTVNKIAVRSVKINGLIGLLHSGHYSGDALMLIAKRSSMNPDYRAKDAEFRQRSSDLQNKLDSLQIVENQHDDDEKEYENSLQIKELSQEQQQEYDEEYEKKLIEQFMRQTKRESNQFMRITSKGSFLITKLNGYDECQQEIQQNDDAISDYYYKQLYHDFSPLYKLATKINVMVIIGMFYYNIVSWFDWLWMW